MSKKKTSKKKALKKRNPKTDNASWASGELKNIRNKVIIKPSGEK